MRDDSFDAVSRLDSPYNSKKAKAMAGLEFTKKGNFY
jgi:hypothetical protein